MKKRGHRNRRFFAALLISLVIHVVVLATLHEGGMREKSVRHYREVSPTLLVTTAEFFPEMPVREDEGPSAPEMEEKAERRPERETSEAVPIPENTAPLPKAPPGNLPKPEVPKQKDESGEPLTATATATGTATATTTNSPAMPNDEQDVSEGSRDKEQQTSAVGGSPDTGSGVHPTAYYDMRDLRDEIERQLLLYIEAHKRYPSPARRRGLDGEVELLLTMTGGKRVELGSTMLIRSAGSTLLDREARRLVESFFPYETDGDQWREIGKELSTTVKISYRLR